MNTIAVILGPTGVGKTETCLSLAEVFHSPIISADSRQMYSEIPIGTSAPDKEELARVKHYFIGNLKLEEYYSAAKYEEDVANLAISLFVNHNPLIMTGGSMMYIDSICNGIDDIPTVTDEVRKTLVERFKEQGLDILVSELHLLDPEYYKEVDRKNPKRVIHALEICYMTGRPYSSFRLGKKKTRPFNIIKIGLSRPREELYDRINRRVDLMIENGLIDEAKRVYDRRHLNSLNTVGYKELFKWMDGYVNNDGSPWTLEFAIDKIKQNSRIYSRKQMTWFKRDTEIKWFHPNETDAIIQYIKEIIHDIETV